MGVLTWKVSLFPAGATVCGYTVNPPGIFPRLHSSKGNSKTGEGRSHHQFPNRKNGDFSPGYIPPKDPTKLEKEEVILSYQIGKMVSKVSFLSPSSLLTLCPHLLFSPYPLPFLLLKWSQEWSTNSRTYMISNCMKITYVLSPPLPLFIPACTHGLNVCCLASTLTLSLRNKWPSLTEPSKDQAWVLLKQPSEWVHLQSKIRAAKGPSWFPVGRWTPRRHTHDSSFGIFTSTSPDAQVRSYRLSVVNQGSTTATTKKSLKFNIDPFGEGVRHSGTDGSPARECPLSSLVSIHVKNY